MEFKEPRAIYLQIVDWICDHILCGKWQPGGRLPSVRELGAQLEVNPNTMMRAYECLQNDGIVYNKRGIGFFVSDDAPCRIADRRREELLATELPDLFRRMELLGIPFNLLHQAYLRHREAHVGE